MKQFKPKKAQGPAVCSLSFSVLALTGDSCEVGWISEQIQLKRNITPLPPKNGNFLLPAKCVITNAVTREKMGMQGLEGRWNRAADAQIFSKSVKSFAMCSLWPI